MFIFSKGNMRSLVLHLLHGFKVCFNFEQMPWIQFLSLNMTKVLYSPRCFKKICCKINMCLNFTPLQAILRSSIQKLQRLTFLWRIFIIILTHKNISFEKNLKNLYDKNVNKTSIEYNLQYLLLTMHKPVKLRIVFGKKKVHEPRENIGQFKGTTDKRF